MPGKPDAVDQALDALDRLRRHLRDVYEGSQTARDDLSVVLHLLVGEGGGYGLVARATAALDLDEPTIAGWNSSVLASAMPSDGGTTARDLPVTLAIRTSPPPEAEDATVLPLSGFLNQQCVRFSITEFGQPQSVSWRDIIKKVRNKFGGHADEKPPRWLEELRYYPAGDSDVVTLLLWSAGNAILRGTAESFARKRVQIPLKGTGERYLGGLDLQEIWVLQDESKMDVRARLSCTNWRSGTWQPVIGARFGERPFIFGVNGDGTLRLAMGQPHTRLQELERTQHHNQPASGGANRAQRRAAERQSRRQ